MVHLLPGLEYMRDWLLKYPVFHMMTHVLQIHYGGGVVFEKMDVETFYIINNMIASPRSITSLEEWHLV